MSLESYYAEAERCSQCSYCEFIPFDQVKSWRFSKGCSSVAFTSFATYSARGRFATSWALLDGRSNYTGAVLDIAYKCQTCGSCDVSCKVCRYNLHPLEMILELRAKLVEDGQHLPQHIPVIQNLRKEGNMTMSQRADRGNWSQRMTVKDLTNQKADVVFHAGCRFSYDKELQKVTETAVSLLMNAGVDVGIMGKAEVCCGGQAYQMGYREDFIKCAERNIKAWTKAGVKTLVTSCSNCYHTFKRLYPSKLGSDFEVIHTVEYLDRLIKEGKIKFTRTIPMTVTYHDPCYLGRLGEPYVPWNGKEKKIKNQIIVYEPKRPRYNGAWGIYDPPRDVLKSIPGLRVVEMERIREYAWCCGAGAGVREAYPEYANWTAKERIEEAKTTGATAIVSACSGCERNFSDAIKNASENMKVLDVAELVQQAI